MNEKRIIALASIAAAGLAALVASIAVAAASADSKPADQPEMQLPPGWTAEDMQAMITAGTPGKMHELLAKNVGTWRCKTTMWMAPGAEPMTSDGKSVYTSILDGRYIKCEMTGEMPGMGSYVGGGIYGFDNVSQKFVGNWIDNHSTGIMIGEGELSADGKTLSWEYTANCPITKGPRKMRDVETITGPNTKVLESFASPPKGGDEFKMMRIEMTKE